MHYCNYSRMQSFHYKNLLENDTVFTLMNFIPPDEQCLDQFYNGVANTSLCYKSKFDILSYLDEDIPGVTIPYFDLMVEGSWQGLKQ